MSAGREFQVDGAATEKARWASSVCMRGTTRSSAIINSLFSLLTVSATDSLSYVIFIRQVMALQCKLPILQQCADKTANL